LVAVAVTHRAPVKAKAAIAPAVVDHGAAGYDTADYDTADYDTIGRRRQQDLGGPPQQPGGWPPGWTNRVPREPGSYWLGHRIDDAAGPAGHHARRPCPLALKAGTWREVLDRMREVGTPVRFGGRRPPHVSRNGPHDFHVFLALVTGDRIPE
jgi:hypothetical protein